MTIGRRYCQPGFTIRMEDREYKKRIQENCAELVDKVDPAQLMPYLSCLTKQDREAITGDERHNGGRSIAAMTLLDRLQRRDEWFPQFISALRETGQLKLARKLDPQETNGTDDNERGEWYVRKKTLEESKATKRIQNTTPDGKTLLRELPYKVTHVIKSLDIPNGLHGGGWRALAAELDFLHKEVQSLEQEESPTESLLERWQQKCPHKATLGRLCQALESMERMDLLDKIYKITSYRHNVSGPRQQVSQDSQVPGPFSPVVDNSDSLSWTSPEAEVTADSRTPETEVTADSRVPETEVTADIRAPETEVTADSRVPETEVTADIRAPETEVTADSRVPETEVTADSRVPETEVTADSRAAGREQVPRTDNQTREEILHQQPIGGSSGPESKVPSSSNTVPGGEPQLALLAEENTDHINDEKCPTTTLGEDLKPSLQPVKEVNPGHIHRKQPQPTEYDQDSACKPPQMTVEAVNGGQIHKEQPPPVQQDQESESKPPPVAAEEVNGHTVAQTDLIENEADSSKDLPFSTQEEGKLPSMSSMQKPLPLSQEEGDNQPSGPSSMHKPLPLSQEEEDNQPSGPPSGSLQKPLLLSKEEENVQPSVPPSVSQQNNLSPPSVVGTGYTHLNITQADGENSYISSGSEVNMLKNRSGFQGLTLDNNITGRSGEHSAGGGTDSSLQHALKLKSPDASLVGRLEESEEDAVLSRGVADGASCPSEHRITLLKHPEDQEESSVVHKVLFRSPSDDSPAVSHQASSLDGDKLTLPAQAPVTLSPVPEHPTSPSYKSKCPEPLTLVDDDTAEDRQRVDRSQIADRPQSGSPAQGHVTDGSPGLRMRRNSLRGGILPELPKLDITPRQPQEFVWDRPAANQAQEPQDRAGLNRLTVAAPFVVFGLLATIGLYKNLR
ncbi:uncharacterized protein LOC106168967 [Lingula anatina]|uniref:Uncharacterized protein LOC106168967 n=1 Tax=Lingula anatina TaxID=7574 RepID=A0A1S3J0B3_LINAN|nr:uncharacterized protein LOC106168967 [Lingula anatina]|eukprot:XP_013403698.1 uncharacterized protein LOC106168967 [Lingula anatina]